MSNVTLDRVVAIVADFVKGRGKKAGTIQADSRLLSDGFVDSFSLVELIAALESTLGVTLADGTLIPEDFETPRVLHGRLEEVLS